MEIRVRNFDCSLRNPVQNLKKIFLFAFYVQLFTHCTARTPFNPNYWFSHYIKGSTPTRNLSTTSKEEI